MWRNMKTKNPDNRERHFTSYKGHSQSPIRQEHNSKRTKRSAERIMNRQKIERYERKEKSERKHSWKGEAFGQLNKRCYNCGSRNHLQKECRRPKRGESQHNNEVSKIQSDPPKEITMDETMSKKDALTPVETHDDKSNTKLWADRMDEEERLANIDAVSAANQISEVKTEKKNQDTPKSMSRDCTLEGNKDSTARMTQNEVRYDDFNVEPASDIKIPPDI